MMGRQLEYYCPFMIHQGPYYTWEQTCSQCEQQSSRFFPEMQTQVLQRYLYADSGTSRRFKLLLHGNTNTEFIVQPAHPASSCWYCREELTNIWWQSAIVPKWLIFHCCGINDLNLHSFPQDSLTHLPQSCQHQETIHFPKFIYLHWSETWGRVSIAGGSRWGLTVQ